MAEKGFIKLSRKFFDNILWNEKRSYSKAEAWIDLLQMARFDIKPEKVMVKMNLITINRGELRASQRFLSVRWSWSLGKVNRFLNVLETERMLERRMEHLETIIKLSRYGDFNPIEKDKMNANEFQTGTLTEHQQEQTKEGKKEEERKEYNYPFSKIKDFQTTLKNFTLNKSYFYIAYRFWELWKKESPKSKTISDANILRWYDTIRLIIETDNQKIERLLIIYFYFDKCQREEVGFDRFWFDTIKSVGGLRVKDKNDVYRIDVIMDKINLKIQSDDSFNELINTKIKEFKQYEIAKLH